MTDADWKEAWRDSWARYTRLKVSLCMLKNMGVESSYMPRPPPDTWQEFRDIELAVVGMVLEGMSDQPRTGALG